MEKFLDKLGDFWFSISEWVAVLLIPLYVFFFAGAISVIERDGLTGVISVVVVGSILALAVGFIDYFFYSGPLTHIRKAYGITNHIRRNYLLLIWFGSWWGLFLVWWFSPVWWIGLIVTIIGFRVMLYVHGKVNFKISGSPEYDEKHRAEMKEAVDKLLNK